MINLQHKNKGFTLIELLVVVAIIGILVTISMPSYQTYVAKAKSVAGLAEIKPAQTAIELAINEGKTNLLLGEDNEVEIGVRNSTSHCASIFYTLAENIDEETVVQCDLVGNPRVEGKMIALNRNTRTGFWNCVTDLEDDIKPLGCSNEDYVTTETTVAIRSN